MEESSGYGIIRETIPNASYGNISLPSDLAYAPEPQSKELEIMTPSEGEWELRAIGMKAGVYDLEIVAWDREGGSSSKILNRITISPGEVHTYKIKYYKKAGFKVEARADQAEKTVNEEEKEKRGRSLLDSSKGKRIRLPLSKSPNLSYRS